MSYLDEPLGIPPGDLAEYFRNSSEGLLRDRGVPPARMEEAVNMAAEYGQHLVRYAERFVVTRGRYANAVQNAVSSTMSKLSLVS
jgi:hypothetical protein